MTPPLRSGQAPLGILHLTTFLQGGAGRAIADLACAQRSSGHRVTVVTSATGQGAFDNYPEYLDRLRAAGVVLHRWDSLFTRDLTLNMRVVARLQAHVDARRLDVVHAHAAVPALIGRLFLREAGRRAAVLQTQHGWGVNKTATQAAFDLAMLKDMDTVVVTSRATAELLVARGCTAPRFEVLPCGLPSEGSAPPAGAVDALAPLRARGARLVGCIGSVTDNKNQRLAIDALTRTDAGVVAVFIGEGGEALAEYARQRGVAERVVICGYQPQAAGWLPLLDALVVPSRTEGQGLVVLEAFRAGVPVIASDIPALAELVEDGGNGVLFESENAGSLAGAISRALGLPAPDRQAMLTAARQRFEGGYTIDRMVARHEALYRRLVQWKKSGGGGPHGAAAGVPGAKRPD